MPTVDGHIYLVTIVEESTRFVAVHPIKWKSYAAEKVIPFVKYFEKQTRYAVKKIHADGGTEFSRVLDYLRDEGLEIDMTAAYTPVSNGLDDRTHKMIIGLARS